jgi:hypothetical protein
MVMIPFHELLISHRYQQSEEDALQESLLGLEEVMGGDLESFSTRRDRFDLDSFLELSLTFPVDAASHPWLAKYLKGLFHTDGSERLGEVQRTAIREWEDKLAPELRRLLMSVHELIDSGLLKVAHTGPERALTLSFMVPGAECFVVLNHAGMEPRMFAGVPSAIMRTLECASEGRLPADAHMLQIYFDGKTKDWKYLFAPTTSGATKGIDRCLDLENGKMMPIPSRDTFLKRFHPPAEDVRKFVVNPFRKE